MRNLAHTVAAVALSIATFGTQARATNTTFNVLSDSAWQEIEASTELENIAEIEALPVLQLDKANTLSIDFRSGKFTNLILDAPFNENEQVGIVVFDAQGEMVHSAAGFYIDLKDLSLTDYYNFDMTYVVKVYSENEVYEAKVQVVYR